MVPVLQKLSELVTAVEIIWTFHENETRHTCQSNPHLGTKGKKRKKMATGNMVAHNGGELSNTSLMCGTVLMIGQHRRAWKVLSEAPYATGYDGIK
jgi:hypothetical protein